ncbi:MAG: hypothetical protein E7043_09500 [Lentisphaerae bacterium]|nr:hypothetical protein [Lentisphaerota bacterium]
MVIKKLNSLFHKHSRVLFGAFTVLIILAFTDFLTPGNIGGCDDPASTRVGTAFGEKVTAGELTDVYHDYSVFCAVMGMEMPNIDARQLFYQLCLIKRAEQLGLQVSDNEIADAISQSPRFGGKFTKEAFDKFLKDNRLSADRVATAMRAILVGSKLEKSFYDSVVVTDDEIKSFYEMAEAGFELDVCRFNAASYPVQEADAKTLREFFEKNKGNYRSEGVWETVTAVIPYAKYNAQAGEKVTAKVLEEAKKVYTNMAEAELRKSLELVEAQKLAALEAGQLARSLYEKIDLSAPADEQIKLFREWAAEKGLELHESGKQPFGDSELSKSLQNMPLAGSRLVSQQYPGVNGVEITMLKDRIDPKQLPLESALLKVKADYKKVQQMVKATEAANDAAGKLAKLEGEARSKAFGELKGEHTKNVKLPQNSLIERLSYGPRSMNDLMAQLALTMKAGDVSPALVDLEKSDAMLIFRVTKRIPADMSKFDSLKVQLGALLKGLKADSLRQEFEAELARQCVFTQATAESEAEK